MSAAKFLRGNVACEPLVHGWYAWPYLIAPHTAAAYVANGHVPVMRSYLEMPDVHAEALLDPAMRGGPFLDFGGGRVDEVQAHLDATVTRLKPLIDVAEAIRTLDESLYAQAKGQSLEPMYTQVPAALDGMVELIYDRGGNAGVRFFEPLAYRRLYDPSVQSIVLSLVDADDARPFVLTTPRLRSPGQVHVDIPLSHPALDRLFGARRTAVDVDALADELGVRPGDRELFATFFTSEPPAQRPAWTSPDVRVRYFGHACVLIESSGTSILVDPLVSYDYPTELERFTYADLPDRIDYVLITHGHQDHLALETLLQLRHKIGEVIVPRGGGGLMEDPNLKRILDVLGFPRVRELDWLDTLEVPGNGRITGLPFVGEHADLRVDSKIGYLVEFDGFRAALVADSNNLEPKIYDSIRETFGEVPLLFVGMECHGAPLSWLYGPLLTRPPLPEHDETRRFSGSDFEKADRLVDQLGAREVYVYALGQEPWLGYITSIWYTEKSEPIVCMRQLLASCRRRGLVAENLYCRMQRTYRRRAIDTASVDPLGLGALPGAETIDPLPFVAAAAPPSIAPSPLPEEA